MRQYCRTPALFLTFLAVACGDGAVTDPLREGFAVDPASFVGEWRLLDAESQVSEEHSATIERGSGVLFGRFTFRLFSQEWRVDFSDARWVESGFRFQDSETYGLIMPAMTWTVSYTPSRTFGPTTYPEYIVFNGIREFRYVRPDAVWPQPEGGILLPPS